MSRAIGIDLGTTNSCASVLEGGEPVIISSSEGLRTTPSVVAFTKKGERLVGAPAKRQAATNPERTIFSIKRRMGSTDRIQIDGDKYTPQEISAMILRKLRKDAEDYLGESVTDAVITVPAYFNDAQRQATKDAGRIAGLNVLRIINEPTAAAFAYGLNNGEPQKVLVYDLGGGTFDVSIIEIGDGLIEVLSTSGDNHLGGDDFDQRVSDYLIQEFKRTDRIDLNRDNAAVTRVHEAAEKAKIELSSSTTATVSIPFISVSGNEPHHMNILLTRSKFDEITHDLVDRTAGPVQNALRDAGITARDLSKILLVGGSTRIPAVQDKVRRMLGMEPSRSINPDECVAMGASIQAGKMAGALPANSAANSLILMDVTPLSLSIETVGGIATRLIERNTTIPARHSQIFTTAANFQTAVDIKVYQGERQFVRDNTLLGNFRLSGIKRAMAGVPQIEVAFDIDVNGILTVSARDLGTGKAQQITITSRNTLSEEEIQRAVHDAEMYEQDDEVRKERFDLHHEAEVLIKQTEVGLADKSKVIDKADRRRIKGLVAQLRKTVYRIKPVNMTSEDLSRLRYEKDELESEATRLNII
ncbi:MAG: molecular chaperone DnaK [Lachnospiraceae bacterium]|nr:molecular chaperone DnaK [Lachnospiraceae bacterium]